VNRLQRNGCLLKAHTRTHTHTHTHTQGRTGVGRSEAAPHELKAGTIAGVPLTSVCAKSRRSSQGVYRRSVPLLVELTMGLGGMLDGK
jgi:hypothetical protein